MPNGTDGIKGGFIEALRTILSSPVGGWALAVCVVAYMGWLTMKDRQIVYGDLARLRETAMPLILETKAVSEKNQRMLEDQQRTLAEINRKLDKQ
jgi:hypothetical protein